jgi:hypothetical protein
MEAALARPDFAVVGERLAEGELKAAARKVRVEALE